MKIQFLLIAFLGTAGMTMAQKSQQFFFQQPKGAICDICTFMVTEIDKMISDEATIEEIISAADQICDALGDLFPGGPLACKILISTQLPQIIDDLIHNQLSPESVCGALGACKNETTTMATTTTMETTTTMHPTPTTKTMPPTSPTTTMAPSSPTSTMFTTTTMETTTNL